jgi:hypothetical protein
LVEGGSLSWSREKIPNTDFLHRNIHLNFLLNWTDKSIIPPHIFVSDDDGMSADWSKYSTPEETRNRARDPFKVGVITMNVGDVRTITINSKQVLKVRHYPVIEPILNRAHSLVIGIHPPNKARIRRQLQGISRWAIPVPDLNDY